MYKYRMWNCDFFDLITDYENMKPVIFYDGFYKKSKFKIEELDLITSKYKSFDDFYEYLLDSGSEFVDENNKKMIITHEHNNNLYYDELIFDDKLVQFAASEIIKSKEQNGGHGIIPNNRFLSYFLNYIEKVAVSDQYKYLLDPNSIKNISVHESKLLDYCIKKDIIVDNKISKRRIHSLLSDYREVYLKNIENINNGYSNYDTSFQLDKLHFRINEHVRSDYTTFRNLVAWTIRYSKIIENKYNKCTSNEEKLYYYKLMNDANVEKKYWNGYIDEGQRLLYYNVDCENVSTTIDKSLKK